MNTVYIGYAPKEDTAYEVLKNPNATGEKILEIPRCES